MTGAAVAKISITCRTSKGINFPLRPTVRCVIDRPYHYFRQSSDIHRYRSREGCCTLSHKQPPRCAPVARLCTLALLQAARDTCNQASGYPPSGLPNRQRPTSSDRQTLQTLQLDFTSLHPNVLLQGPWLPAATAKVCLPAPAIVRGDRQAGRQIVRAS